MLAHIIFSAKIGSLVLIHEAPAIRCATLTRHLVVALLFFEAVVIGQLLTNANVLTGKEDKVGLPLHFQHLGVHAGRAAVILQWNLQA